MPFTKWIEHFVILPLRWYKINIRNWCEMRQRCKICGCADKFNFHIEDSVWTQIVPVSYQNRVICLSCFDDLAKKKGVDYSTSLKTLLFAGDNTVINFKANKD